MAYYEALASSAPRKINLTKIDQIGYDLLLVGRNLFCFPLLLDIKFAVLFRQRVLVWRGKRCVCGNHGEVQHARGGRKRQNSLLAFVRESRTLEQVGLHGRVIIELRILCQHPPNLPVSFSISQKVHFYQIVCRRSRSACLCSRTPENQQAVPTACQTATTRAAACQDFCQLRFAERKRNF